MLVTISKLTVEYREDPCGIFQGVKGLKEGKEGVTRVSLEDRLGGVGTPFSKRLLVYSSILLRVNAPSFVPHLSCGPSGRLDQSPLEACHFQKTY